MAGNYQRLPQAKDALIIIIKPYHSLKLIKIKVYTIICMYSMFNLFAR